ncbi:hypothetical protein CEE39_08355 [bacterium (candidate division B38) B3_B38]|nr:MAG: hypothetical protein CEE39_08355 [bacterium (candidate division B38) B3_B38]
MIFKGRKTILWAAIVFLLVPSLAAYQERTTIEEFWSIGEERAYSFAINQVEIGYQWNKLVEKTLYQGQPAYHFEHRLSLDFGPIGGELRVESRAELLVTPQGLPLYYRAEGEARGVKQSVEMEFTAEGVKATTERNGQKSPLTGKLSPGSYFLENNIMGQFNILLGMERPSPGETAETRFFSLNAFREIDYQLKGLPEETLVIQGREQRCSVLEDSLGSKLWLSKEGKLLRLEMPAQKLVIRLVEEEPTPLPAGAARPGSALATLFRMVELGGIFLLMGLPWLLLLGRDGLRRWYFWLILLVVTCGMLPLTLKVQPFLQAKYSQVVARPLMDRGLTIYIAMVGTFALSGIVQEFLKWLPIYAYRLIARGKANYRKIIAVGLAAGLGFGWWEAWWLFKSGFGIIPFTFWAYFERFFAIMFHSASAVLLAHGVATRRSGRFYALAAFLHGLGNYTILLTLQNLISTTQLEVLIAIYDGLILTATLWLIYRYKKLKAIKPAPA